MSCRACIKEAAVMECFLHSGLPLNSHSRHVSSCASFRICHFLADLKLRQLQTRASLGCRLHFVRINRHVSSFRMGQTQPSVTSVCFAHCIPCNICKLGKTTCVGLCTHPQESIDANKPPGSRGQYWKSMHVCTTMGPSVRVSVASLNAVKPKVGQGA